LAQRQEEHARPAQVAEQQRPGGEASARGHRADAEERSAEELPGQETQIKEEHVAAETYGADEKTSKEDERRAHETAETERTIAALRAKNKELERARLAESALLASRARQDKVAREKQEALERERDQSKYTAMQRYEAATLRRTDAGAALTDAHDREGEIGRRRLQAARKLARATAAFEKARQLREVAERREAAAKRALDSAVGDLDRVDIAAEHGRLATREALTHLHVAQQEEFEAQVGFLPYDDAESALDLDDTVSDDPMQPVDQGGTGHSVEGTDVGRDRGSSSIPRYEL
jgi:hypothetical protein